MEQLFAGTIAEGAEIEFVEEEAVFKCRNCNYEWKLKEVKDKFDERIKEDIHFIPEVVHAFLACRSAAVMISRSSREGGEFTLLE